ncbi:MAG: 16S rRNA (cytosine(967)-C(5))-methyltransferase RsmB, partial [Verrucomicrobiota bacterium]
LVEWENTTSHAHDLLEKYGKHLSGPDRALAQEILFGCLRHLYWLDAIIGQLRKGKIKLGTQCLLRIGLYQLLKTQIAEHAAIHETVNLAKKHEKGLVNAILRRAQRERSELEAFAETLPLEDKFSHPQFLIDRWTEQLGEKTTESLCRWNNQPSHVYARVQRKWQPLDRLMDAVTDQDARDFISQCSPVSGQPDFIKLPAGKIPEELLSLGAIYIQDPSTALAPRLLAPQENELILDACAAPGGKAAYLADLMPDTATLFATDSNDRRIRRMQSNFKRLGVADKVQVSKLDWTAPHDATLPLFDAILLDVPCSNSGVMQRRVDVRWRLQPYDFDRLAKLQKTLLAEARNFLKPGGRIIYSTCSFDSEENQQLIESSGMEIIAKKSTTPWDDGIDGAFAAVLKT